MLFRLQLRPWDFLLAMAVVIGSITTASAQDSSHSSGWVVLPLEEYRSLRAKAYPVEPEPTPQPVQATLTRIDYDLHIQGDIAGGRAILTIDVLKDGWVRIPIPASLLVREAKLDGQMVALAPATSASGNQLSAVLAHSGRAILTLDVALSVGASGGEESLLVPSAASGITRVAVDLPRQGVDITLESGLLVQKSETAAGSKWVAYGRGADPLVFRWRRRSEEQRNHQPLRLRGTLTELVGLGEDSTSITAEISLQITQGAARGISVQLPENVTVNQVLGATIADWEQKSGELAVSFLEPVEDGAKFVLQAEAHLPREGEIEIPILRLANTERDSGGLAVEVLGAGEIKGLKTRGLDQADASDLGRMVADRQSPSLVSFRFHSGDARTERSLQVNVARYTQQAVLLANVEEARYEALVSSEGKILVWARYAVRNNQRNFVKIALPPGSTVWSAELSGRPVRPGQAPDGSLLLPLEKARGDDAPTFATELVYLTRDTSWHDKGSYKLTLPALDLPVSRTGLLVYYSPRFRVAAEPGTFRAQEYEAPVSAVLRPPNASAVGGAVAARSGRDVSSLSTSQPGAPGADAKTQSLVDQFRAKSESGRTAGILPVKISFPTFGSSLFLVSELTGENQAANVTLNYQHEKKAGAK